MADGAAIRTSIKAHLFAGLLAVAGIAGAAAIYLFPLVLASSSKGFREAGVSAALVAAGSVAAGLTIWLLFYLPLSVAAGKIVRERRARLWLSALLCTAGLAIAAQALVHRGGFHPLAKVLLFAACFVVGVGCALYSFLAGWAADRVAKGKKGSAVNLVAGRIGPATERPIVRGTSMTSRAKARVLAAVVVAVLFGIAGYQMESQRSAMGKDAFLASQAERFDKFYAKVHPISHFLAVGALIGGGFLGVYELLSLGFFVAIRPKRDDGAA